MLPVRAPALIGRDAELAELRTLIGLPEAAADPDGSAVGSPRAVLLSGDAGMGKTRLLTELREQAAAQGWSVVVGHCLDLADAALPYLPVSEILGRLAGDLPAGSARDDLDHPSLARLLPGRRLRGGPGESEQTVERGELFAAVHTLLEQAGAERPLLVVVEDLHWADPSTRDLLGYLFTRGFTTPVAVVASYRSDDLHRRHPLRAPAAEWSRLPGVHRLHLSGLSEPAVRELVAELAPDVTGSAVTDVVSRADGNAFFVEELLASCDTGDGRGATVPDSLADLLLLRLDRLGDAARLVVRLASVAGRRVAHDVLAAVSWLGETELDEGIRQAVEMNVLSTEAGGYAFRHALLAEAVHDDLLPGERVRLHASFVTAITSGAVAGTAAELARHALLAHDLETAVTASIEAGDEAAVVGGPEEAARHYEQALALLTERRGAAATGSGIDVSRVVVRAAGALRAGGDGQRAASLLTDQLERLPADAPPTWRPLLLSTLAQHLLILETDRDCVALSAEAVASTPDGESELRAEILSNHARVLENAAQVEEALVVGMAALRMAEHLDLPVLASEITTTLGRLQQPGEQTSVRRSLEEAVDRAVAAGALDAELRARYLLARSYEDACEWEPAGQWFASAMELGDGSGVPWTPYGLESRWKLAQVRVAQGRWDEVLRWCAPADHPQAPAVPRAMLESIRLAVRSWRGERVDTALAGLRPYWELEGAVIIHASPLEIRAAELRADEAGVIAAHDAAVGVLERIWHPFFSARIRLSAVAIGALCALLPAITATRRAEVHRRIDSWLAAGTTAVERYTAPTGLWGVEGRAWHRRLQAETLRARWISGIDAPSQDELTERWAETEQLFAEQGHVPGLAEVRAIRSTVLRSLGDAATADRLAEQVRATADQLGAVGLTELLGTSTGRRLLTPREQEVLGLVAEGRSNAEIGRRLFISAKTVSVHVSNVLAKLEAGSRTEAAALARRRGLIG